ncbi:cytochrome c3 family protein [candidate division KSB1 bacterium]
MYSSKNVEMKLPVSALFVFIVLVLLCVSNAAGQTTDNNCVDCHGQLEDIVQAPVINMENDVHFRKGIFCSDCHGGDSRIDPRDDPYVAMDPNKGYIGSIDRSGVPEFCDRCHGNAEYMKDFNPNLRIDQYERYKTSRHGQLLAAGDEKGAVCTDCHAIHEMRQVNDPAAKVYPFRVSETCGTCHSDEDYMAPYRIPTDQDEEYRSSVHYEFLVTRGDLAAPTCNDCHGNHGAIPPGLSNIHNVCGTCHVNNKELFDRSRHREAFYDMDMPECVTCHSNHATTYSSDEMLSTEGGICWDCHDVDSEMGEQIVSIYSEITDLNRRYLYADSLITIAEEKGMEVSELKIEMIDLMMNITKSRNLVHTLSLEEVRTETVRGSDLAGQIITGGNEALAEINRRRLGLFISLLFILLVITGLYLKIRRFPGADK